MFVNIPDELKQRNQWLVWRYEETVGGKPTKVPYNPHTGHHSSVTNPGTWTAFDAVTASLSSGHWSGIGFVFSEYDPYTFIDLDDASKMPNGEPNPEWPAMLERQKLVYETFDSYSERSPSGNGLHIIVKGNVKGAGRKRASIEVYSRERYATFTGDVFPAGNPKPIAERQELLDKLYGELGKGINPTIFDGSAPQTSSDQEIIERACRAINGDKFAKLLAGEWQDVYPEVAARGQGASEADFAFIDMLAFYTQNRDQIGRIFWSSPLGQRPKARRPDYVNMMIHKSFDRLVPPIDLEGFGNSMREYIAQIKTGSATEVTNPVPPMAGPHEEQQQASLADMVIEGNPYIPPPGLMGEVAQYIYNQAARPVPEVALAAAIGFMAGLCGRAFNTPTGTGLNLYVLLVAVTGTGKEAMKAGIDQLINALRFQIPAIMQIKGPGDVASGQGLMRFLAKKDRVPSCLSILGEVSYKLETWTSKNSNSAQQMVLSMILELYMKSGQGSWVDPTVYSATEKNIDTIQAPAFSILGETVPERLYEIIDDTMVASGFLPRFTIIEYKGDRPEPNPNVGTVFPSQELLAGLSNLTMQSLKANQQNVAIKVKLDRQAEQIFQSFERYCDDKMRGQREVLRHLWNRAHLKALRLACLVAVGVNWVEPTVNAEYADWAINIVMHEVSLIARKFVTGEIGVAAGSDQKQDQDMRRIIKEYLLSDEGEVRRYKLTYEVWHNRILTHSYLSRRLIAMASFRKAREGATNAIKRCLRELVDSGVLREVAVNDPVRIKLETSGKLYAVSNPSLL